MLWLSYVETAEVYFKTSILHELLGKWYTRPSENSVIALPGPATSEEEAPSIGNATEVYCYCRGPELEMTWLPVTILHAHTYGFISTV